MSAPRFWKGIAVEWPRSPKPVALLAEFGSAGPLLWIYLVLETKAAEYRELDKSRRTPGRVTLAWPTLGQLVGTTPEDARAILTRLCELGEVDVEDHGHAFTATLLDWPRWETEPKDPAEAARSKAKRERSTTGQRPDDDPHRDKDSHTDRNKDASTIGETK